MELLARAIPGGLVIVALLTTTATAALAAAEARGEDRRRRVARTVGHGKSPFPDRTYRIHIQVWTRNGSIPYALC